MAQRRHHGGAFKARVAAEAIAGRKTVNEIASTYEIHPSQVAKWKSEALTRLPEVLSADITYIRLSQGFVYLVVILDWFSRYMLGPQTR